MGSRKTIGVMNREKTRSRREVAKAAGNCTVCFTEPAVRKTICPAGVAGGRWCASSPPHDHTEVPTATCATCRKKKTAKRASAAASTIAALLIACLAAPASAGCLPASQAALTVVEAADAYSIAAMKWHGSPNYDQTAPLCAKSLVNEIACQGAANLVIRHFEKPTIGTCIANYVATIAYGWYIRKAVRATVLSVRF